MRLAVLVYFVLLGLTEGMWVARIPGVKAGLHLPDGLLGASLLVGPAGLVAVMPLAGRLADQFGSTRLIRPAGAAVAVLPLFLWTASTLAAVLVAVLAFGVAGGMLSVGLNAQGVQVEQAYGRPLMASFHASFSVGGLAGALLGGWLAWRQVSSLGHPQIVVLGVVVLAGLTAAVAAGRWLIREPADHGRRPPAWRWPVRGWPVRGWPVRGWPVSCWPVRRGPRSPRLTALGLLALCCLIADGAAGSWSGVYLRDDLGAPRGYAAAGFAGFSLAMAAGRMAGDRITARSGPVCLVRGCGLLTSAGLAVALCTHSPVGAVIGFAACGAGLSCTVPQFLSAAGRVDPERPGAGIARVASLGYFGLVGGPPLIGGCASVVGLTAALCIPVALGLCVAFFGAIVVPGRAAEDPAGPARNPVVDAVLNPAMVSGTDPAQPAGSRSR
jgi:MFS family permease